MFSESLQKVNPVNIVNHLAAKDLRAWGRLNVDLTFASTCPNEYLLPFKLSKKENVDVVFTICCLSPMLAIKQAADACLTTLFFQPWLVCYSCSDEPNAAYLEIRFTGFVVLKNQV